MKIYKKYDTYKNKEYNLLAKEYIEKNNVKCKYYGFMGMAGSCDLILIDGKFYRFYIETKQLKSIENWEE
jgi:hypothetical protein